MIIGEVKIKFVKKANMFCKTYFVADSQGKPVQKQEWFSERPNEDIPNE